LASAGSGQGGGVSARVTLVGAVNGDVAGGFGGVDALDAPDAPIPTTERPAVIVSTTAIANAKGRRRPPARFGRDG
jgi:hypothetical protein